MTPRLFEFVTVAAAHSDEPLACSDLALPELQTDIVEIFPAAVPDLDTLITLNIGKPPGRPVRARMVAGSQIAFTLGVRDGFLHLLFAEAAKFDPAAAAVAPGVPMPLRGSHLTAGNEHQVGFGAVEVNLLGE